MEYDTKPFAQAALDVLSPVLIRLHEVESHLRKNEVLSARGAFLGLDEQVTELASLLKTAARVARTKNDN